MLSKYVEIQAETAAWEKLLSDTGEMMEHLRAVGWFLWTQREINSYCLVRGLHQHRAVPFSCPRKISMALCLWTWDQYLCPYQEQRERENWGGLNEMQEMPEETSLSIAKPVGLHCLLPGGLRGSSCTQLNLSHKIKQYLLKTRLSPRLLWKFLAGFHHGSGVLTLKVGCTANATWGWSSRENMALINCLSLELPLAHTQSLYLILTTFVDINTSCISFKWRFLLHWDIWLDGNHTYS